MNLHDPVLNTHDLVDRLVKVLGLDADRAAAVERQVRAHSEAHRTWTFLWAVAEPPRPLPLQAWMDAAPETQVSRTAVLSFERGQLVSIAAFDGLPVWSATA